MKRINTIFCLAAALMTLAGCSKEAQVVDDGQMHFVPALPMTKATDTAFEAGDAFGIYAMEYNGAAASPMQLSGNWANNAKSTLNGSAWTVEPKIWWKDGATFDVVAYYPYTAELSSVDNYLFEVQTDQRNGGFTKSDLMWAKTAGVKREDGDIALNFRHRLSRLDVNLIKGEDYEGDLPATATVQVMNTVTSALVDITSGELEKNPYGETETVIADQVGTGRFSAIIVPQRLMNQVPLVEVIVKGVSYLVTTRFVFEPGVRHTINITLSSDPDKVLINIGGGIEGWN